MGVDGPDACPRLRSLEPFTPSMARVSWAALRSLEKISVARKETLPRFPPRSECLPVLCNSAPRASVGPCVGPSGLPEQRTTAWGLRYPRNWILAVWRLELRDQGAGRSGVCRELLPGSGQPCGGAPGDSVRRTLIPPQGPPHTTSSPPKAPPRDPSLRG